MNDARLETLRRLLEANPEDCFVHYGLAQELVKRGRAADALEEFLRVLAINPDYQAAYYHAGKTCETLGEKEQAVQLYRDGIEASRRTGDLHARSELAGALAELKG